MSGLEQRIHDAVHGQTQPTVTVLSSLLAVEDELGYIPKEALDFVARFSNATVNDVWAVASFYPNFRFEPPAEHVVEVRNVVDLLDRLFDIVGDPTKLNFLLFVVQDDVA